MVVEPGTTVTSPRGTRVEVVENSPERFQLKRTLPPKTGKTLPHFHEDGTERFEVVEGKATGSVGGDSRELAAGDVLDVPRGAKHVHPHTAAAETATVLHLIEPRPRFVEVYFRSWLGWLGEGRTDAQDEPPFLGVMAVIEEGGGGSWLAGPPIPLQKGMAKVMAPVARRRGYHASVP